MFVTGVKFQVCSLLNVVFFLLLFYFILLYLFGFCVKVLIVVGVKLCSKRQMHD